MLVFWKYHCQRICRVTDKSCYLQRITCPVRMSVIRAVFQEVIKTNRTFSRVNFYVQAERRELYWYTSAVSCAFLLALVLILSNTNHQTTEQFISFLSLFLSNMWHYKLFYFTMALLLLVLLFCIVSQNILQFFQFNFIPDSTSCILFKLFW